MESVVLVSVEQGVDLAHMGSAEEANAGGGCRVETHQRGIVLNHPGGFEERSIPSYSQHKVSVLPGFFLGPIAETDFNASLFEPVTN